MSAELCRGVAYEAVRRGAHADVHELWALLELVDGISPSLIVDVGSGEPVWWAWWQLGARVVGVKPGPPVAGTWSTDLPSSVVDIIGDRRDPSVILRVTDQLGGVLADVVVLAASSDEGECRADWAAYSPMCRPGGRMVVAGIASPTSPGVGQFWLDAGPPDRNMKELIAARNPIGYGVLTLRGEPG